MSKVWELAGYDGEDYYSAMLGSLLMSRCWYCGDRSRPSGFYAPWMVERAHIVSKPRKLDRRVVVGLCSVCHRIQHGERLSGIERPRLCVASMLWLKREVDPEWYDPDFMQRCSVRRLPDPEEPEFCIRPVMRWRGEVWRA